MLTESSRNPVAAAVEQEAGWYLLSSLLASMPKEVNSCFRLILRDHTPFRKRIASMPTYKLHMDHAGNGGPSF